MTDLSKFPCPYLPGDEVEITVPHLLKRVDNGEEMILRGTISAVSTLGTVTVDVPQWGGEAMQIICPWQNVYRVAVIKAPETPLNATESPETPPRGTPMHLDPDDALVNALRGVLTDKELEHLATAVNWNSSLFGGPTLGLFIESAHQKSLLNNAVNARDDGGYVSPSIRAAADGNDSKESH